MEFVHQRSAREAAGGLLSVHWIRFLVGLAARLTGVASGFSVFAPRLRLDILPDAWPLDFEMASELSSLAVVSDFLIRRCGGLAQAASLYNFKRRFQPAGNRAIWFIPAPSRALRVGLALASALEPAMAAVGQVGGAPHTGGGGPGSVGSARRVASSAVRRPGGNP